VNLTTGDDDNDDTDSDNDGDDGDDGGDAVAETRRENAECKESVQSHRGTLTYII